MENQRGSTRTLDELGRVVIPGDIRETMGWGMGTRLEVEISDVNIKTITIREVSPCCSLCRTACEDLVEVEKGFVCPQCAGKIR